MDLEIEKYVKKQTQLQEQIEKLFAEKKILQDQISVLNECLSLEKVNRKISELENKQKILTSLESMVNNLRTDIKPLEYLKQVLQRQLMVSTLPTNDLNIEERKYSENSICAIETLDSLSDSNSEESIMVLSDYDVISDEEDFNDAEKPVENKVMYDEALQMASSVYLTLVEHPFPNIGSTQPLMNNSDLQKDIECPVQSNSINPISLMNTSIESEKLLDLYDVVDKQDLLNGNENVCLLFYLLYPLLYFYNIFIVFCELVFCIYLVYMVFRIKEKSNRHLIKNICHVNIISNLVILE